MWYRRERWRLRLVAESAVMKIRFPGFRLHVMDNGQLRWVGILRPFEGVAFRVGVEYPADFPYRAPSLLVLEPGLVPGTPHVYADGSVCIHATSWDPERATAARCTTLLAGWLLAYVHWLETGETF